MRWLWSLFRKRSEEPRSTSPYRVAPPGFEASAPPVAPRDVIPDAPIAPTPPRCPPRRDTPRGVLVGLAALATAAAALLAARNIPVSGPSPASALVARVLLATLGLLAALVFACACVADFRGGPSLAPRWKEIGGAIVALLLFSGMVALAAPVAVESGGDLVLGREVMRRTVRAVERTAPRWRTIERTQGGYSRSGGRRAHTTTTVYEPGCVRLSLDDGTEFCAERFDRHPVRAGDAIQVVRLRWSRRVLDWSR